MKVDPWEIDLLGVDLVRGDLVGLTQFIAPQ